MIPIMNDLLNVPMGKMKCSTRLNPMSGRTEKLITFLYSAHELYVDDLYRIYKNLEDKKALDVQISYCRKQCAKSVIRITSTFN